MKKYNDCFEMIRNGRVFCICRISVSTSAESFAGEPIFSGILQKAKEGILASLANFAPSEEESLRSLRCGIVPYRYVLDVNETEMAENLSAVNVCASFDARFPGGTHYMHKYSFTFDAESRTPIPPHPALFSKLSLRKRKALGKPISLEIRDKEAFLVFEKGAVSQNAEELAKKYNLLRKSVLKFTKKLLTKSK